MKYYQIENQVDTEEVGKNIFPQTDGFVGVDVFKYPSSYSRLTYHSMPDYFIAEEKIKLANSAKQSDFISTAIISAFGFILSDRTIEIINLYKIVNNRVFKIPIVHKNFDLSHYNWLHLYDPNQDFINFEKSAFQVKRFSNIIKDDIRFKSTDDYWEQRKNYEPGQLFKAKKLYLNKCEYDFLYLGLGGVKYLISQRLLEDFQNNRITGYKTMELENVTIE